MWLSRIHCQGCLESETRNLVRVCPENHQFYQNQGSVLKAEFWTFPRNLLFFTGGCMPKEPYFCLLTWMHQWTLGLAQSWSLSMVWIELKSGVHWGTYQWKRLIACLENEEESPPHTNTHRWIQEAQN